jgi:hypothetical protein
MTGEGLYDQVPTRKRGRDVFSPPLSDQLRNTYGITGLNPPKSPIILYESVNASLTEFKDLLPE